MMFPDNPILDRSLDKFNRFTFSQRIAEIISSKRDSSSIVIGIYGAWGEGKTTVFNFIETALENNSSIVCVRFNPWFFRNEEKLFLSFFQTLADALKRKLTTKKEEIGGWLTTLGKISAPLSVADPSGSVRGSGQLLENLGNLFSQVELEENKKRLEKILEEENKKLVIFIDDIDRLDKSEIQSIFKLVKLSAGFKNTTYLLAFDEEKVASAISDKYGSGDLEAGRSFLEKIIQVPLTLPQVSNSSLQKFCFECVDEALKNANLELTKEDFRRFVKCFSEGLAVQLKTPRLAQRYANTITFSIPLLKGEVNIVDLLLVEGIKVFYPKLYSSIKDKPSYFLGEVLDKGGDYEQVKKIVIDYINQSISDLSQDAQIYAKNLLKELFPRLTGVIENIHYGSDWQIRWTEQKRIASLKYFKRYFAYGIPEDDISDQSLLVFLNQLEQSDGANISNEIKEITNNKSSNTDSFITEIFKRIEQLSSLASQKLALALAEMGSYFPKPQTLDSLSPFSRAGILVSYLIEKIDESDKRLSLAKQVLQIANPLCFTLECFKWMKAAKAKKDDEKKDSEGLFSKSDISILAEVVIHRIRDVAQEKAIYLKFPESTREILRFWAYSSSKEETNKYLRKIFEQDPNNAVDFIKCYIPNKGALRRETYDEIVCVIEANLLIETLKKVYGNKLNSPESEDQNDCQLTEELAACQFVYIHNKVLADEAG